MKRDGEQLRRADAELRDLPGPGPGKVVRGLGPFLLAEMRRAGVEIVQGPWPLGDGSLGVTVATDAALPEHVIIAVGAGCVSITNVGSTYLERLGYEGTPERKRDPCRPRVRLS